MVSPKNFIRFKRFQTLVGKLKDKMPLLKRVLVLVIANLGLLNCKEILGPRLCNFLGSFLAITAIMFFFAKILIKIGFLQLKTVVWLFAWSSAQVKRLVYCKQNLNFPYPLIILFCFGDV